MAELPGGSPSTPTAGLGLEGLRAFVARVRGDHHRSQPALQLPGLAHEVARLGPGTPLGPGSVPPSHFDVEAVRRDFPILAERVNGRPLVWLDNAATTQKPQVVMDALARFYSHDNSNIHRAAHTLAARATDGYESARRTVQRFLGAARPEEVIFVRGCTEGINLVAATLSSTFRPGDEIVLPELEHHANIVPWQMAAERTGAVIRMAPIDDRGELVLEA